MPALLTMELPDKPLIRVPLKSFQIQFPAKAGHGRTTPTPAELFIPRDLGVVPGHPADTVFFEIQRGKEGLGDLIEFKVHIEITNAHNEVEATVECPKSYLATLSQRGEDESGPNSNHVIELHDVIVTPAGDASAIRIKVDDKKNKNRQT